MYARYIQRSASRKFLGCQQIALLRPSLSAYRQPQLSFSHHFLRTQPHCRTTSSPILENALCDAPKSIASVSKWGFIIYRCDYQSDDAWNKFINGWAVLVKEQLREWYKDSDKLLQTLDFTVIDDRPCLDGASIEKVRTLHTAWAESDEMMAEQMEAAKTGTHFMSRYSYCIHVDTASLDSCLEYFSPSQNKDVAYVNLISTPYPRPINQDEIEAEAREEGWDLFDDSPVSIKANISSVLPEMYGEVEDGYDIWAREISRDPDSVFAL